MDGPVAAGEFWGKLEPRDVRPARHWHPLADHCCDVAMVCEALLTRTLLGQRLARLAGRDVLDAATVARLCTIAALHDLGKFSHTFQDKAHQPVTWRSSGHVGPGAAVLRSFDWNHPLFAADCLAPLFEETHQDAVHALLLASVAHHGRPVPPMAAAGEWHARGDRDPAAGVRALVLACRFWFPEAFASDSWAVPAASPFQHAYAGLVMLADWLGSDTRWFGFRAQSNTDDRGGYARSQAALALGAIGIDTSGLRCKPQAPWERLLPNGCEPRPVQIDLARLPMQASGSVECLEAETGSGKTEAALARFAGLFAAGLVDGLYFALPTRTAATQLHARVVVAARKLWDEAAPEPVLAVPGYVQAGDHHGQRMPDFKVLWPDTPGWPAVAGRWAAESPKRFLCATIAVGTIDQVLLAALQVDHAHLRATALCRQLLVVDEVHASDSFMTEILRRVLQGHLDAGGHALLLSATLGEAMRARLLPPRGRIRMKSLADAESVAYPAIHSGTAVEAPAVVGPGKTVAMQRVPALGDFAAVAALAAAAASRGARVLVVRNRVADAVATQRSLELALVNQRALLFGVAGIPAPHHSRFAAPDRKCLDAAIEQAFGKDRPAGGCVAVATQTVQQSLDLDADLLVTDLCPVDVLLQRIGRLHRHERQRPSGFESPRCVVLVPDDLDLSTWLDDKGRVQRRLAGLGSVYDDLRVLQACLDLLVAHDEWRIPAMNRMLVERGTHPEVLAGMEARSPAFAAHAMQTLGKRLAANGQAHLWTWRHDEDFGTTQFADKALGETIRTRLGADDRLIELSKAEVSPFGLSFQSLAVPGWLCRGVASDAQPQLDGREAPGVWHLQFGALTLQYDRLGLRPVDRALTGEDLDG